MSEEPQNTAGIKQCSSCIQTGIIVVNDVTESSLDHSDHTITEFKMKRMFGKVSSS